MKKIDRKKKKRLTVLFVSFVLLICFTGIFASDVELPFSQNQDVTQEETNENMVEEEATEENSEQGNTTEKNNSTIDNIKEEEDNFPSLEWELEHGRYKPKHVKIPEDDRMLASTYAMTNLQIKCWEAGSEYTSTHKFKPPTSPPEIITGHHPSLLKIRGYGKVFCTESGYVIKQTNGNYITPVTNSTQWNSDSYWETCQWTVSTYGPIVNDIKNKVYRIGCEYYGKNAVDNGWQGSSFTQMAMWNMMPSSPNFAEGKDANGNYYSYFTGSKKNEYLAFLNNIVIPQLNLWNTKPSFTGSTVNLKLGETKTLTDTNKTLRYYSTFTYTSGGVTIKHTKGQDTMTVTAAQNANESVIMAENVLINNGVCKYPYSTSFDGTYAEFYHAKNQNLVLCNGRVTPIGMSLNVKVDVNGFAKIKKTTAHDSGLITLCPKQYSLEDAEYGVYNSYTDAENDINKVTVIKTGKDGVSNAVALNSRTNNGQYYLKEIKAPKGHIKNINIYDFKITLGQTTTINVEDEPYFDPMTLILQKKVPNGHPEFQKYLEGAEYTVRYYQETEVSGQKITSEAQLKGLTPVRTWVFRTDKNGIIKYADKWRVGGDELFKNEKGMTVGLIGTYAFEETKAPDGFKKNDGMEIRLVEQGKHPADITAENSPIASELPDDINRKIKVSKRIPLGHIFDPFGTPTVIFELSGRDIYGNKITQRKCIEMTWKDTYNPDKARYEASVTFDNLPPGEYTVREISSSRYIITRVYAVSDNGKINGEEVEFELVNNHEGKVHYQNKINTWKDLSHRTSVINKFRPKA